MCNPRVSSKWIEDNHLALEPYEKTVKFSDKQIDHILHNGETIKRLQLAGGEPFYMPSVERLLKGLVDKQYSKQIDLQITTNLTYLNNNILQLLEQFKKIVITISVDGLKEVGEYIRYPMKWNVFENNLNTLLQHKHIRIAVNITKSLLNSEHINSILEWCNTKGLTDVDVNNLTYPSILAIGNPRSELITWLTALDNHRGTDSKSVLPWIYK
jgi:sulfatase maturation enzyme AslB (radical SAM superfamily)